MVICKSRAASIGVYNDRRLRLVFTNTLRVRQHYILGITIVHGLQYPHLIGAVIATIENQICPKLHILVRSHGHMLLLPAFNIWTTN